MPDGSPTEAPTTRVLEAPEGTQRAGEILALARTAFVEKGFTGASMQDLARAAGMSAGNFYRYFPSKAALVEALIARDLAEVEDAFRAIAASPDPLSALKAALRDEVVVKCGNDGTLWAEIAATATRKPEVATVLARMEDGITSRIAHVLGIVAGLPPSEAERRFGDHARVVFLIMHGLMTSHAGQAGRSGRLNDLVLGTIDRVMDDALARGQGG